MASAYTIITEPAPGTPEGLDVRIVVMRRDSRDLTRAQLEALFTVYPPLAKHHDAMRASIDAVPGPTTAPKPRAKAATKPSKAAKTAKASKPRAAAPKPKKAPRRAAAKRPVK